MRAVALLIAWIALAAPTALAGVEVKVHELKVDGRIDGVRRADFDRDGRPDLVLLVTRAAEDGTIHQEIQLLPTPAETVEGRFWDPATRRVIRLDEGVLATAGALSVGRFGEGGAWRLRFFAPDGIHDWTTDAQPVRRPTWTVFPCLLGRSMDRGIRFRDQHADLDGDGTEECWAPTAGGSGGMRVLSPTTALDLDLTLFNRGAADETDAFIRYTRVPRLEVCDLDGDGSRELVAWKDDALVAWSPTGDGKPLWRLPLPFTRNNLTPEEVHTPRIQLADVDGDGKTDLLVTLVTGRRTELGSFRTRLYHFPGPFRDPEKGTLVKAGAKIDTESVALHPHFVDVDGDGALDYVCDSITGTKQDLIRRVLGQEPTIWHVSYRFDPEQRTFERTPYFRIERPYSREEAISNRFGRSAYFDGDFDRDGHNDLLDLGNLMGAEILGAVRRTDGEVGAPIAFKRRLLERRRARGTLRGEAITADFDRDGYVDAVVWDETTVYLLVPRRTAE